MTTIDDMPYCVMGIILGYVDIRSRVRFSLTCKKYSLKYYPPMSQVIKFMTQVIISKNSIMEKMKSRKKDSLRAIYETVPIQKFICRICLRVYDSRNDFENCEICDKLACVECCEQYEEYYNQYGYCDKYVCDSCREHCMCHYSKLDIESAKTRIKCAYCKNIFCESCKEYKDCVKCCNHGICNSCKILGFQCTTTGKIKCRKCINKK